MYATIGTDVPREPGWTFEPKYDGMRVLAFIALLPIIISQRVGIQTHFGGTSVLIVVGVLLGLAAAGRSRQR